MDICPKTEAQFSAYAGQFRRQFDADDGPMGVSPDGN
jgi:hypothetical protein